MGFTVKKKLLSAVLTASMVMGMLSCGAREPEAGSQTDTDATDTPEVRNGAILAGMASSLVMNGIAQGLGAIPGMPKEITALFGGGGADNTAVLAAIAKLAEAIAVLDAKVDAVAAQIRVLDTKVTLIAAAVSELGKQQCGNEKRSRFTELTAVIDVIDTTFNALFNKQDGIATGIVNEIIEKKTEIPLSPMQVVELTNVYRTLGNSTAFDTVTTTLNRTIMGNASYGSGLLAYMQYCTQANQRFLTKKDTDIWQAYAEYFTLVAVKALQLTAFKEAFRVYSENSVLDLRKLNVAALETQKLIEDISFFGQISIPQGQTLDTRTNRMWTAGAANRATTPKVYYDAIHTCFTNRSPINNTAASHNADGLGWKVATQTVNLKNCVYDVALDSRAQLGTDQWHVPEVYELASGTTSGTSVASPAASSKAGLIDNWDSAAICGNALNACGTPSQYLLAVGAKELVNRLGGDLGYVWSRTSLAAANSPTGSLDNNLQYQNNNAALTDHNGFTSLKGYHYNGGFLWGSAFFAAYQKSCEDEFNSGTKNATRLATCNNEFGSRQYGERCSAILNGQPMPFSMASIKVVNFGPAVAPLRYPTLADRISGGVTTNYQMAQPGKNATFFGSRDFLWQYFACGRLDRSCNWLDECDFWEVKTFESFLPQVASVLFVRDLMPGEQYLFTDQAGQADPYSWDRIASERKPIVLITTISNGIVRMNAISSNESTPARCDVDPATAPKSYSELPPTSDKCTYNRAFKLKPGTHKIYAAAYDQGRSSEILVREVTTAGVSPPPAQGVSVSSTSKSVTFSIATLNADYDYFGEVVAQGTSAIPVRCKIDPVTKSCVIGSLVNNSSYSATMLTEFGNLSSRSVTQTVVPFGAPLAATASIYRRSNGSVTLSISTTDSASIKTPITAYELWVKEGNIDVKRSTCPVDPQTTRCTLNDLDNASSYLVYVRSINEVDGTNSPLLAVRSLAPPGAPGAVSIAGSKGVINVLWDRETTGGLAAQYVATAYKPDSTVAGSCTSNGNVKNSEVLVTPALNCDIVGLDGEITYSVKVIAKNDGGDSLPASAAKTIKPQFLPGAPTAVAKIRDSRIFVEAVPGSGGSVTSIAVNSITGGLTCSIVLPATECEMVTALRDVPYSFQSVATNLSGGSTSSAISNSVLVYSPPSQPRIAAVDNGKSLLSVLMIKSLTEAVDGWVVSATPGNATCTVTLPSLSCDVIGLTNGIPYEVSAKAFNNGGSSVDSALSTPRTPIAEPERPRQPSIVLGKEQATIQVARTTDPNTTRYVVKSIGDNMSCEIVVPDVSCTIDQLEVGFSYTFTATAYNKIGPSIPSLETVSVIPLAVPIAPSDVILTTNYRDIVVEVLPDADSSPATKYRVTASPGNYSCVATAASAKCVLQNSARGKEYTVTAVAENSGGTSEVFTRVYYLTAPPEVPDSVDISSSPSGLVVGLDVKGMNTDSDSVRITSSPGGATCEIVLPATTCAIETDTSVKHTLTAVGVGPDGELSSIDVKEDSPVFVDKSASIQLITPGGALTAGSIKTLSTKQVEQQIAQEVAIQPEVSVEFGHQKDKESNKQLSQLFKKVASTTYKKLKTSGYSAKVLPVSRKICQIKKSEVVVIGKGDCALAISLTVEVKGKKSKKKTTMHLKVG